MAPHNRSVAGGIFNTKGHKGRKDRQPVVGRHRQWGVAGRAWREVMAVGRGGEPLRATHRATAGNARANFAGVMSGRILRG